MYKPFRQAPLGVLVLLLVLTLLTGTVYADPRVGPVTPENSIIGQTNYNKIGSGNTIQLPSGNIVIVSPSWSSGRGAVTCLTPTEYRTGGIVVSAANSLIGSSSLGDYIGSGGVVVLTNGNYVVVSPDWNNFLTESAGAVTWVNGSTCIPRGSSTRGAVISAANSLIGNGTEDFIGGGGVIALKNGNYVVASPSWSNGTVSNVGAVTWGNGSTGTAGIVSPTNSLVGSTAEDAIAYYNGISGASLIALANGNYVVRSRDWDNGAITNAGAVTWGNGNGGTVGVINAANSLVGSKEEEAIGTRILALANGHYLVQSHRWINAEGISVGAATWGNGNGGTIGVISAANSLVGSTLADQVGDKAVALTNGNYVTYTTAWDNGMEQEAGAVTWGDGNGGTVGIVSASNSLVGLWRNNQLGYDGVIALTNGNYVVLSSWWGDGTEGTNLHKGAATWGNGLGGTVGSVNATNSLVGSKASNSVGRSAVALTNGNYVVLSPNWDYGYEYNAGAATWGNGNGGTVGVVSAENSLIGSKAGDGVGDRGVIALTNGNYVVKVPRWDNGTITDAGAVTWGNGSGGTVGMVTTANSLVGSTSQDQVGDAVIPLSNGNYVVLSRYWNNGTSTEAGAATWGNGSGGTVGVVSTANSLVGAKAYDRVGYYGITELTNGNFVIASPDWDNDQITDAGAVTWSNGLGGTVGVVNAINSLIGAKADDRVQGNRIKGE